MADGADMMMALPPTPEEDAAWWRSMIKRARAGFQVPGPIPASWWASQDPESPLGPKAARQAYFQGAVVKHGGPGPHAGTGTTQKVHGRGGGGGGLKGKPQIGPVGDALIEFYANRAALDSSVGYVVRHYAPLEGMRPEEAERYKEMLVDYYIDQPMGGSTRVIDTQIRLEAEALAEASGYDNHYKAASLAREQILRDWSDGKRPDLGQLDPTTRQAVLDAYNERLAAYLDDPSLPKLTDEAKDLIKFHSVRLMEAELANPASTPSDMEGFREREKLRRELREAYDDIRDMPPISEAAIDNNFRLSSEMAIAGEDRGAVKDRIARDVTARIDSDPDIDFPETLLKPSLDRGLAWSDLLDIRNHWVYSRQSLARDIDESVERSGLRAKADSDDYRFVLGVQQSLHNALTFDNSYKVIEDWHKLGVDVVSSEWTAERIAERPIQDTVGYIYKRYSTGDVDNFVSDVVAAPNRYRRVLQGLLGRDPDEYVIRAKDSAYDFVDREILGRWASTAGDHDDKALAIQMRAADLHRRYPEYPSAQIEDMFSHMDDAHRRGAKKQIDDNPDWTQAVDASLIAIYRETQDKLQAEYPSGSILLHRGFKEPGGPSAHALVLEPRGTDYNGPLVNGVLVTGNPLQSWSTDPAVAYRFAGSNGVVYSAEIPIEQIHSTALTGQGALSNGENEVITIGRQQEWTRTDPHPGVREDHPALEDPRVWDSTNNRPRDADGDGIIFEGTDQERRA